MAPFERQLENLSFVMTSINAKNKWMFTEETVGKQWNGFAIICNLEPKASEFCITALTLPPRKFLDKKTLQKLTENNISLDTVGITKRIKIDQLSSIDLTQELNILTSTATLAGFDPRWILL